LRRQTAVALAGVAAAAEGLQVGDGVGAALVFGDDGCHLHGAVVLAEGIEALAAQLQQRVALAIAQLYCYAEPFGNAAYQAVGALVVAGEAVEGEPCSPGAAVPAGPIPRLYHPHACSVRMPP
jgi:hypothetical protein